MNLRNALISVENQEQSPEMMLSTVASPAQVQVVEWNNVRPEETGGQEPFAVQEDVPGPGIVFPATILFIVRQGAAAAMILTAAEPECSSHDKPIEN